MINKSQILQLLIKCTIGSVLAMNIASCANTAQNENGVPSLQAISQPSLTQEQREAVLKSMGEGWIYGNGIGDTIITAGTVLIFPPSLIYFLGNTALSLSGHEPLRVSDALPDESRAQWNSAYDSISSGPGRVSAALAGREYITRDRASENISTQLAPKN